MDGPSVEERLKQLRHRVHEACKKYSRDPETVHILTVSKFQPITKIRAAYECGQRDFAENYVQEALEKLEQLASLPVRWHFIGRIQSNKIKYLNERFAVIHSVDRIAVAEHLNRRRQNGRQQIFIQFNIAGESSKGGAIGDQELRSLAEFVIKKCPRLSLLGIMVMPPLDATDPRHYFRQAKELLERIRGELSSEELKQHPMNQLSMGTSHDFEDAIAEGATWIRIGTDAFGPRDNGVNE